MAGIAELLRCHFRRSITHRATVCSVEVKGVLRHRPKQSEASLK
jgi:hypothetical protein